MKKLFFILTILLIPVSLFAAGAGGGGGGVSGGSACTKSTWACSEWSACSVEGKQTRACTKTFDCPSDTVRPPEEQSCTLPPAAPTPTPLPAPVPEKQPEPKKPDVALPPVRTHWCYTLPLLKQRVECRLGLSEKDLAAEYAKQYLPEECRAVRAKKAQGDCVIRYKALTPCWKKPIGEERTTCAREVIGLPRDLAKEKKSCASQKKQKDRLACLASLRQKAYTLVKFRFYDLNERVEDFLKERNTIDGRAGIQFVVTSELNKQKFNNARNKAQRLQIIKNERAAWKQVVRALKIDDVRDFLDDAMKELSIVE